MLVFLASTELAQKGGLLDELGINLQLFIVQVVAFLIVFAILRKFVWPPLMQALDERQRKIEESLNAAEAARKAAEKTEADLERRREEAKKEAADIVALARKEASMAIAEAQEKAQKKAEHMIAQAEARLEQSVSEARAALLKESLQLVREATQKVLKGVVTDKVELY
jgi:F-type H+-transporting ATPase subunit b